jgi:hypothetical protein
VLSVLRKIEKLRRRVDPFDFEVAMLADVADAITKLLHLAPEPRHVHGVEQRVELPQAVLARQPSPN